MTGVQNHPELRALLEWWEDAGVDYDRFMVGQTLKSLRQDAGPRSTPPASADAASVASKSARQSARDLAAAAGTLEALRQAVEGFDLCDLKRNATNTVFADGAPEADLMIIGEGPGRDEDLRGLPFVGRSGQLLDRMFASIGYRRGENLYITNANFWRPPGNRNPTPEELALCAPFVARHIELVKPKLIVAAGAVSARTLLQTEDGIMRLRGRALEYGGAKYSCPLIPILHPAYLLRRPQEKAKAWQDLLLIEQTLDALGVKAGPKP